METKAAKQHPISFENTAIAFGHKTDKELDFSIWLFKLMQNQTLVKWSTSAAQLALNLHLPISRIVKATVFKQFCGGETIEDCNKAIISLGKAGIGAILDYSIEGAQDEETFNSTAEELLRNSDKASSSPHIPVTCMKLTGIIRFGLLEKVSADIELSDTEKQEYSRGIRRVHRICERAHKNGVPIYIDAEETWIQPAIDRLAEGMMRQYNSEKAIVFTTMQMYRHDQIDHLHKLLDEAKREGFVAGVKFVRGAYLEKENERAIKMGYPTLMQPNKESSDKDYNKALQISIQNIQNISICAGTHNEYSSQFLTELMKKAGLPNNHPHIYFSQLYGMSDHISYNLANKGYSVSKYLPYGPVKATMPYLIRRAEENSAIAGQMSKELQLLTSEKNRRKQ